MPRLMVDFIDLSLELLSNRTFDGRLQLVEYTPTVLAGPPVTGGADASK